MVAQGVTGSSVACAGTVSSAGSEFSAAGAAGGDSLSSGVASATRGRKDSVCSTSDGTVASGNGVGSGILARAQAAMHGLWSSAAGVVMPLQAGHDIGARGAARAPAGPKDVERDDGGSETSVAWAEEKTRLLSWVEELKREIAGLSLELKSKRARTRRGNAKMKQDLTRQHKEQVAQLRSDAKAAWDAGAAQATELAQAQRVCSELHQQLELANNEIADLKSLLRSTVERTAASPDMGIAKNPESLSSKVAAVVDTSSVKKPDIVKQQQDMMAMLRDMMHGRGGTRQQFKQ